EEERDRMPFAVGNAHAAGCECRQHGAEDAHREQPGSVVARKEQPEKQKKPGQARDPHDNPPAAVFSRWIGDTPTRAVENPLLILYSARAADRRKARGMPAPPSRRLAGGTRAPRVGHLAGPAST